VASFTDSFGVMFHTILTVNLGVDPDVKVSAIAAFCLFRKHYIVASVSMLVGFLLAALLTLFRVM